MSEGRRDPETGGRSLADILREAGVESPTRSGRRRRWDDTDDTGVRQRGSGGDRDSDTGRVGSRPDFGRRATDVEPAAGEPAAADERRRATDERPRRVEDRSRKTEDRSRKAEDRVRKAEDRSRKVEDRVRKADERPRKAEEPAPKADEPSTAAIPGLRPSRKPGVPGAAGRGRGGERGPSTGPIPAVRDGDADVAEEPLGPREGALAWLRFGGELVVALAAGVGIYFLFTVLWELLPHLAVVLAPLAVTALVGGVGAWRQRGGREPAGLRLIAVLVFAGTLLTIAPAAGLLAAA
ncbi:MAG TPA: hypothetical protein VHF92_18160 [Geodermatophilus sp.]|nr:hypothetical protein [Geodermatophilus sp.]